MEEMQKEVKTVKNYPDIAIASILYAIFYTFCLYRNSSGITFPLFTAGTICYFYFCLRRLGETVKKNSLPYLICIELLGISTCLTGDSRIIAMNKLAIFLLLIHFLLHNCYEDEKWGFFKYAGAVVSTIILPLGYLAKPITDLQQYLKTQRKEPSGQRKKLIRQVLTGIAICVPLVLLVMTLLISADSIFANVFRTIFGEIILGQTFWDAVMMILLTVIVFFFSYMLIYYIQQKDLAQETPYREAAEPVAAITVTAVLSGIYLLFCGIQIVYLFLGGAGGMLTLPAGITYSAYARSGFFQLLFVCMLNFMIVLVGNYRFQKHPVLNVFLYLITGCTFVMIASSAMRMILYIQYQYLTFLRIFVLWALFVIALLMIGVTISIRRKEFPLFRYCVTVLTVCYVLFSFGRPDYFIAKVNTDNMEKRTQYEFFSNSPVYKDQQYLAYYLCSDAAPVLISSEALNVYQKDTDGTYDYDTDSEWRSIYISRMDAQTSDLGLRSLNLSRSIARDTIGTFSKY